MYSHHLQQSPDRYASGGYSHRSDPQGYENRGGGNSTPNNENQGRKMRQTPPSSRPPLSGSSDRRDVLYNSFTSSYNERSSTDSKRDPPTMAGDASDPQRTRRVNFSKQLEVHEKHRAQSPSTPTVPILRSKTKAKNNNVPTPRSETRKKDHSRRDPTPRSGERYMRSMEKRKTINDILNELANSESADGPSEAQSSDPPLERHRRPLYSPAAPKSPRDIFSKMALREKSGSLSGKQENNTKKSSEKRKSIEPEAATSLPRTTSNRREPVSSQSWDLSDLFPDTSQVTTPVGAISNFAAGREPTSDSQRPSVAALPDSTLRAYEPRSDHWDAPDLYPESWNKYSVVTSPSNSSTESQDACLIQRYQPASNGGESSSPDSLYGGLAHDMLPIQDTSSHPLGACYSDQRQSNSSSKGRLKHNDKYGYAQLDEEMVENNGTELVLLPGNTKEPERSHKRNISSVTPQKIRKNLGSLLKRSAPGPPNVPFQELPVLAMSFEEESADLKKATDDTESDSGVFDGISEDRNHFSRGGHKSGVTLHDDDDDELFMPRQGRKRRKNWKIVIMLVCLVVVFLSVGLPVYQTLVVKKVGDAESLEPFNTMKECVDGSVDTTEFSRRYSEMRKVIVATTGSDATKIDETGSAQRKALCWISDVDSKNGTFDGGDIPAIIQRYSVAVLYYSLVDENDDSERSLSRTNFLSSSHECEWDVVMCGAPTTVTALLLADKMLSGSIPDEIGNLGSLSFLELSLNDLRGTIPNSIEKLTLLEYFAVAFNAFSGAIPSELGVLTRLEFLNMRSSQVVGKIPTELGRLGRLETLLLEGNWLSGTIPVQLGNLARAQQMSFRKNYLTGRVPNGLCELRDVALVELKVDSWIDCNCCTA